MQLPCSLLSLPDNPDMKHRYGVGVIPDPIKNKPISWGRRKGDLFPSAHREVLSGPWMGPPDSTE